VALPSWHPKANRSTIVAALDGPATSFQHSWVVTEQGAAQIWPASSREQAAHLIAVAHPRARAALRDEAQRRALIS
jgi:acyl-CoA hydrolase